MTLQRTSSEEIAFKTAEMNAILQEAGFLLAYADPEAARDFGYRARYIRSKSTFFPLLNASLEYYLASKAYSLKISPSDDKDGAIYAFLAKNYRGDLKELLEHYFESVRRGTPFKLAEKKTS